MRQVQHEETGMQYNIGDDEEIPRRCYLVPNCEHEELGEPSRVLGSNDPLERACIGCGTLEKDFITIREKY